MLALALVLAAQAVVVDLSQPLENAEGVNANLATCVLPAASAPIESYLLLHQGKVLAEKYAAGQDEGTRNHVWSVTKSWSGLLVGMLVDQGLLSVEQTLGEIFPSDAWAGVEDATAKQAVTLRLLLTMEAGFVSSGCGTCDPTGLGGSQESLAEVLNSGEFNSGSGYVYDATRHILAYVVLQAAGVPPQQYAVESGAFDALGLQEPMWEWATNQAGVGLSAFGLSLTLRAMGAFGQLFLQGGLAAPGGTQVLSEAWVSASTSYQTAWSPWSGVPSGCPNLAILGYGYQWWVMRNTRVYGEKGVFSCALGHEGQYICVYPQAEVVLVIQSSDYSLAACQLIVAPTTLFPGGEVPVSDCDARPPSPPSPPSPPGDSASSDAPCFGRESTTACRVLAPPSAVTAVTAAAAYERCFGGTGLGTGLGAELGAGRPHKAEGPEGAEGPAGSSEHAIAERVLLDQLGAGDVVLDSAASATSVVVVQHSAAAAPVTSALLLLNHSEGSLQLTPNHVLLLDGRYTAARHAVAGARLSSGARVTSVAAVPSRSVINPITASGRLLVAGKEGMPVTAATGNEWIANVLLSSFPRYTLSFALAAALPASAQAYYDSLLEPLFNCAVPALAALKRAATAPMVAAGLALGDLLIAVGLVYFLLARLSAVALLAGLATGLRRRRKRH